MSRAEVRACRIYGKEYIKFIKSMYRECANSKVQFKIILDLLPEMTREEVKEICDNSNRTLTDRRCVMIDDRRQRCEITTALIDKIILCRKNNVSIKRTAEICCCSIPTVEKYSNIARKEGRL